MKCSQNKKKSAMNIFEKKDHFSDRKIAINFSPWH
jgi:hypothetical protein